MELTLREPAAALLGQYATARIMAEEYRDGILPRAKWRGQTGGSPRASMRSRLSGRLVQRPKRLHAGEAIQKSRQDKERRDGDTPHICLQGAGFFGFSHHVRRRQTWTQESELGVPINQTPRQSVRLSSSLGTIIT